LRDRFGFILVVAVQLICAAFYIYLLLANTVGLRSTPINWQFYEAIEMAAAFGLLLGFGTSAAMLRRSLHRTKRAEDSLRLASGAFMDVLDERFDEWALTPAERDVALFSVKGMSIAEIAAIRSTSEGTVKAQTNAIYRKAGVSGRPQLLSLFIDDLMGAPLPGVPAESPAPRKVG